MRRRRVNPAINALWTVPLLVGLAGAAAAQESDYRGRPVATYSIVAFDSVSGELGPFNESIPNEPSNRSDKVRSGTDFRNVEPIRADSRKLAIAASFLALIQRQM